MKVLRLSAIGTGRLYPPGNIPGTHFCWGRDSVVSYSVAICYGLGGPGIESVRFEAQHEEVVQCGSASQRVASSVQ